MSTILGLDCTLYHNSGTYGSPTWAKSGAARDVTLEVQVTEVDASRRSSNGWRENETTLKDATLNVTFVKDKADTTFVAIEAAYKANTAMEMAVVDGANAVGSDWLDAMWKATQWNESQELEGVVTIDATFRPAPDTSLKPNYGTGALPTSRP